MKIELENFPDFLGQKIHDLAHYCADQLFPEYKNFALIEIVAEPRMYAKEGTMASVYPVTDEEDLPWMDFYLQVDPTVSLEDILVCIAHEMVHVKQYMLGEMRDGGSEKRVIWQDELMDISNLCYTKFPWEKEAYAKQEELYDSWRNNA